ncbi:MAG: hypothetical protein HKM95_18480 [Inquilinus sp.]|nr:hypothetical protein [Inquilinus sp.]
MATLDRDTVPRPPTLHRSAGRFDRWIVGPALLVALVLLAAGVVLPSLTVRTLAVLSNSVSILSGLGVLWGDDQLFLFAVLLVFSVLFPTAKLLFALWVWFAAEDGHAASVRRLEGLAKWSMLDVLVIALIVAALNLTVISGVFVHAGLYLFTGSVVLSKLALSRIGRVARHGNQPSSPS